MLIAIPFVLPVQRGDGAVDAVFDRHVAGRRGLADLKGDGGVAVEPGKAAFLGMAVGDGGQIAQPHILRGAQRDGEIAQLLHRRRGAQHADGLLTPARFGAAAGVVAVELGQRGVDRIGRDAMGGHAVGIEGDVDFRLTPPIRFTCATPRCACKARATVSSTNHDRSTALTPGALTA